MSGRMASLWYRVGETVLLLLALLLPLAFYLRTYDSVAIKTALFEVGVLTLLFAWLLKGMERGRWELPVKSAALLAPAAALLAWTVLRFLTAPCPLAALPGFLKQVLYIAVYAVAVLEFGGYQTISRFTDLALASAWLACLYGLVQRLGLDPFIWKGAFGERVFSSFGNPDLYGLFLALVFPLALTKLLDPERDSILKKADLCLLALLGLNLIWTGSAEGLAAFAIMGLASALTLPIFFPSRTSMKTAVLSLATVLCVLVGAGALNAPAIEKDMLRQTEFKRQAWAATARMIAERPLTGFGPGSFFIHFPRFRPAEIIRLENVHNGETDHPESQLLETTAELGLVGAGLWLWLFGSVLFSAWRARRLFIRQGALGESSCLAGLCALAAGFLVSSQLGIGSQFLVPGWLIWPAAGFLGGLSLLAQRGGALAVLPLPLGESQRKRLYAPPLLAFAGLAVFPALWLESDVQHKIAIYYSKNHEWDKALAHYESVWPGADSYVMAQYFKGSVYLDSGKPEEALRQYAKVEALAPDYVLLHYQKGLAYAALHDWRSAMESHARAQRLDPLYVKNYERLSAAALAAGEMEEARKAAFSAIALEPKEPSHWLALSNIYLKERRVAAARRVRQEAARLRRAAPRSKADAG